MGTIVAGDNFRRFLTLSLKFFLGSSVASLAVLSASLILAKNLTLHEFGVLALIQASLSVIEGVSSSQSWQGLVRFLPKSSSTSAIGVGRLIKITLITDIFNAILASVILIFVVYFSNWFGIPNSELLLLYGLVLPFRMNGTWQGIARSQNKLVLINIQLIISGFGKLITAFGVFFIPETTFSTVVLGFVLSEIISYLVLIISGIVIVDKQWTLSSLIFDGRQQYTNDSEIRKFIFINHFNVSSVLAIRNVDELIVGKLISPEVTGVYKLIKLISALLSKVIEPMYIVIYPEFNRLLSHGKTSELKNMLRRISRITIIASILFISICAIVGDFSINYFSENYSSVYYWSLMIYVVGMAFNMVFFFAHPLAISLGLELFVLKGNVVLGVFYIIILWLLGSYLGLIGICISTSLYILLSAVFRLWGSVNKFKGLYE